MVTFSDDVEVVYIEACNGGRKVSELTSPKKKHKKNAAVPTPPEGDDESQQPKLKKYKLRGKNGPVFVELTEEAAAYIKCVPRVQCALSPSFAP